MSANSAKGANGNGSEDDFPILHMDGRIVKINTGQAVISPRPKKGGRTIMSPTARVDRRRSSAVRTKPVYKIAKTSAQLS